MNTLVSMTRRFVVAGLALALAGVLAAGCSSGSGGSSASGEAGSAGGAAGASTVDVSGLKTVGDIMAIGEGGMGYSWDDNYFVCVADPEGMFVRGVAKITPEVKEQLEKIDTDAEDFMEQQDAIFAALTLETVEDLSSGIRPQSDLDQFVGKTGQDLLDEGFTFSNYNGYGGEETYAEYADGYYAYEVIFDKTVPESSIEDEGESLLDAPITSISYWAASAAAMDPSLVE